MRKMKTKVLPLFVTICLVASLFVGAIEVRADIAPAPITVTTEKDFIEAVKSLGSEYSEVILGADITFTDDNSNGNNEACQIYGTQGAEILIDLNGHTLNLGHFCFQLWFEENNAATVRVIDSSPEKTGVISKPFSDGNAIFKPYCADASWNGYKLIIDGVRVIGNEDSSWISLINDSNNIRGNISYEIKNVTMSNVTLFYQYNDNETDNLSTFQFSNIISEQNDNVKPVKIASNITTPVSEILAPGQILVYNYFDPSTGTYTERTANSSDLVQNIQSGEENGTGSDHSYIKIMNEVLDISAPAFGNVSWGYSSITPQNITLTNNSSSELTIGSITCDSKNFTIVGSGEVTVAAGTSQQTDYTIRPIDNLEPGDYTADIVATVSDGRTYTRKVTFHVKKRFLDPTPTVILADTVYSDTLQPSVSGNTENAAVTFIYYDENQAELSDIPTNVGTYYIAAEIGDTGHYYGCRTEKTEFHIVKKNVTVTIAEEIAPLEYTGEEIQVCPDIAVDPNSALTPGIDYVYEYSNNINAGTATVTVKEGTGDTDGNYTFEPVSKDFTITPKELTGDNTVLSLPQPQYRKTGSPITPEPTVTVSFGDSRTETLTKGTDYDVSYENNIDFGTATVTVTGKGNYTGMVSTTFKIAEYAADLLRVYGHTRYQTSYKLASLDELEAYKAGDGKYSTMVVASGLDFPDALSGSYVSKQLQAPIVLYNPTDPDSASEFIKNNLTTGGEIFILGGNGVIPSTFESTMKDLGYSVTRLAGNNRYDTNMAILNNMDVASGSDILVTAGTGYADGLSASSTEKAILMVGDSLTKDQISFLQENSSSNIYILGGTGAVNSTIEQQIKNNVQGEVKRLAGADRYETSLLIAEEFMPDAKRAVVVYGNNFPDALSAGPVAQVIHAPLIMATDSSADTISAYMKKKNITAGIITGGPSLISDAAVHKIFNNDTSITESS